MRNLVLTGLFAFVFCQLEVFAYNGYGYGRDGFRGDRDSVIYGEDDRVEVYSNVHPYYANLARSTAAMIPNASFAFTQREDILQIQGKTLGEFMNLCEGEKFRDQISAAMCSGFLVAPNLLVTAGHCIRRQADCTGNKWVFGFGAMGKDQYGAEYIHSANVYSCKRVVRSVLDNTNGNDYAVVELDRPVLYRQPLRVRTQGAINQGAPLVVIGHPSGIPTKAAAGAGVRDISNSVYFSANLDTFGGNSGSAVFNAQTGVVEGILVRGEQDYVWDSNRGCRKAKVCGNNECRGEDVTRITNVEEIMSLYQ